jgi:GAF domain-containing protein
MRQRLISWFPLGLYTDPVRRQQAFNVYSIGMILALVGIGFTPITIRNFLVGGFTPVNWVLFFLSVVVVIVSFNAIFTTRRGKVTTGRWIIYIELAVAVIVLSVTTVPNSRIQAGVSLLGMAIWLVSSVLIGDPRQLTITSVASFILVFTLSLLVYTPFSPGVSAQNIADFQQWNIQLGIAILACIGISYLVYRAYNETVQRAGAIAAERAEVAIVGTQFAKLSTQHLPLGELLPAALTSIKSAFSQIETAQVWLIDSDRRFASLAHTTNTVLVNSPEGKERVGVGTLNPVGRVAVAGKLLLVKNQPDEQTYRRDSLPAGIESQLVLPLISNNEVIGVLDVQSTSINGFEQIDIEALENLSVQLTAAIDATRLNTLAETFQTDNRRLTEQLRENASEIDKLNQQLAGQAWGEYLRARVGSVSHTLNFADQQLENFAEWTENLVEAAREGEPIIRAGSQAKVVSFPITIRGQVIGGMEFELDPDQLVERTQLSTIQQVIDRAALSAENIRLFDEAQRIAQREAMINEITERMQGSTNIEATLTAAAQGLSGVLNTTRVAIRIGQPTPANERSTR